MAEVIEKVIRNGREVLVYDSGLERDAETGYIVKPAPKDLITKENSHEFHRARQKKQLEALDAGMLEGIERKEFIEKYGENAWIVAIGHTTMIKATTPEDPKQVEAARFLREWRSSLSEEKEAGEDRRAPARVVLLLAELTQRDDTGEVIDADLNDEKEL